MGAKILLVDDEARLINIMKPKLESWGYEVTTADNGDEAIKRLKAESPDLLLLDLNMAEKDGWKP